MMSKDLVGFEELDGSGCRVGIVKTRWNPEIMSSLYDGVKAALKDCGVKDANIYDTTVPGSFELPLAARFLAMSRQCDVVITLGCLIKGETMHFEYIAEAVSKGLMDVSRVHSFFPSFLSDGHLTDDR
jgi:6,7-dimethyl-8-ribityllumazine synthase